MRPKPVVLVILDGWGLRKNKYLNAVKTAKTPNFDFFWKNWPHSVLQASGEAVGLPEGFQGNSEVGHLNIGAGRIVYQHLKMINDEIKKGSFSKNKAFLDAFKNCKKHDSVLHLMGLIQDQGVHAVTSHCIELLKLCKKHKLKKVFIHAFTDGRDTPPKSAAKFLAELQKAIDKLKIGKIVTVCGRYFSMDRDNRWNRTKLAYDMLVKGKGERVSSWKQALKLAYSKGETDEFIKPKIIGDFKGVQDYDSVIFFNYRLDRPRQLTHAFLDKRFSYFKRVKRKVFFVAFSEYYKGLSKIKNARVAFPVKKLKNTLGEVLSKHKLKQFRIAETEKYAHVTFFFNDLVEKPFPLEFRKIIPSPKVATYDLKPEMSAFKIKNAVVDAVKNNKFDVIIMNFANCDMVGHTADFKAAVRACEAVDNCLGQVVNAVLDKQGVVLIIADHGNCEDMTKNWCSSHTLNPVPFILVGKRFRLKRTGTLADVAPTLLQVLGIRKPKEMTGRSLILV